MRLLLPPGARIRRRRLAGLAVSMALHLASAALLILQGPAPADALASSEGGDGIAVMQVPADVLLPVDPAPDDNEDVEVPPVDQQLVVDDVSFDLKKIRRRRNALFPFLTGDVLFLERVLEAARVDSRRLRNPLGQAPDPDRPPLELAPEDIQRVVDASWARRDRWGRFGQLASMLEAHDPRRGRAADLVHEYLDQNLLQPYEDAGTRDAKYWVMMELVSDHVDFIDFIRGFTRRDPSSRVTTELLFLLDELAQGSLDSMLTLLETNPATDLTTTLGLDREAFGLAENLGVYYRTWLLEHQLDSRASLVARYEDQRLRILNAVLASTPAGYRSGDARFLIGRIQFGRNDIAAALRSWSAIVPQADDNYFATYSAIQEALAAQGDRAIPRIAGILGGERVRWLEFSRERLRAFGYAFNTF